MLMQWNFLKSMQQRILKSKVYFRNPKKDADCQNPSKEGFEIQAKKDFEIHVKKTLEIHAKKTFEIQKRISNTSKEGFKIQATKREGVGVFVPNV